LGRLRNYNQGLCPQYKTLALFNTYIPNFPTFDRAMNCLSDFSWSFLYSCWPGIVCDLKAREAEALTRSIEISNDLSKSAGAGYMEVLMTRRDALESRSELIETKKTANERLGQYISRPWRWLELAAPLVKAAIRQPLFHTPNPGKFTPF
jgi:hypothetical protein